MKYAIVGKSGRVVKAYKTEGEATKVLESLKDTGAILKVLAEAAPKGIRNAGLLKHYRASTIEKVAAIITAGQERPRYALYCEGILVAYAPTEEAAVFLQRKARGFVRRLLQRKYHFRIEAMSRSERQVVA